MKWLRLGVVSLSIAWIVVVFIICFFTPALVYLLDNLHLRSFFLPDLTCNACNNFSTKFIIENSDYCKDASGQYEDITLLLLVASYHPNAQARQAIRSTWATVRRYKQHNVRTLFIFGVHNDKNLNAQIQYELREHGDVIQANFTDRYLTLTNKTIIGLQWAMTNCPNVKYILKTDDDAFNIPQRFVDYVGTIKTERFVGGYCFTIKPDRRDGSKFFTRPDQYPDYYYPTYCSGPGYLLSRTAVLDILRVSINMRYLHMEDVFVTGICRSGIDVPYTQVPGVLMDQSYFDKCSVSTWIKNSHNVIPEQMTYLWNDVVLKGDKSKDCVTNYLKMFVILIVFVALLVKTLHRMYS